MYTNGLKDRFGSPLISINYADDRYVRQEEIDFQHKSIEQKIVEVEKSLQFLNDNFYKLKDEVHYDKITSVEDETFDTTQHYHEQVSATNATSQGESSGFKIAAWNLPNDWSIEKIEIPVLNTVTVEHYLGAYIVTGNNKEAILSDNATAWTSGTTATWTFNNNPITVPLGSSLELYIITSADGLGQTEGTRSNHKINTYCNNNGTGAIRYDGVWYGDRDVLCTFSCGVKIKELKSSVEELQSTTEELSSILSKTNDGKIDPLITRLSTYNRYETNYFSTNVESSNSAVSSFRFGFKHFPHGLVKRISLYGRDAITSNVPEAHTTGCYLMANIYKKDGTLVSSTSSTNKLVAQFRPNGSTVVLNTWEFDNLVTPKEDEVIKFIPSPDGVTQVANYNLGILVDNYHTHEDCMCGGDGDFVNNPLASGSKWLAIAIIEGDFIHDNEGQNHFTDTKKHLNSVERGVLESLYTPTNVLAWDNNYTNATLGAGSMKGFIISRPYITNGKFKEVRWTSQGTATNAAVYMKITLRDTNGAPIKSYVSNNTENFNVAGLKSFRFNEEWEVDDSVSSISFEPCNADGTVRTDVQIRTRIIGNAADNNSDGSESTNANYKVHVQFYKIGSVTNKFTSHVGDNTHLTNEQKTLLTEFKENKDNYIKVENQDIDYVIETGVSNNNWYRIYKSGWVEQGGVTATGSSGTTERTVTLPVELKTSNYFVQLTQTGYYNSTYAYQAKDLTVTNFKVYAHTGGVQQTAAMWEAKGLRNITNDIIKANGYIPNASSWNSSVFVPNNLTITRVENEAGYNGNTKSITMQTSLIQNGSNLMKDNTNLTSWNSDLSSLTNGSSMFKNCTNLTTVSFGENGLGSLTTGTDMFKGCSLNYQSLNNILNALPSGSGTIHITVDDSAQTEMAGNSDFMGAEIPSHHSGAYYEYTHSSGWTVQVTSRAGFSLATDAGNGSS